MDKSSTVENSASALSFVELNVPFPSVRHAKIAYDSLRIDKEPKRGGCSKELSLESNKLVVHFKAKEARFLRVAVNSFLEFLTLVTETIEQFDVLDNKDL